MTKGSMGQPTEADVVIVGGGPGGYTAAFYAADRGRKVVLVDQEPSLGGVCLLRGCIPSKAFLHATKVMREAEESAQRGIVFQRPTVNLEQLRTWKESVIKKLAGGLATLSARRSVQIVRGRGYFEGSGLLRVETAEGQHYLRYEKAIVAVGSKPALPSAFDLGNPRVMTSTEALLLEDIPNRLLVVGAGYIGMELGTVYATLGSRVVLVEALGTILPGIDPDLVRPVARFAQRAFHEVRVNAKVVKMSTSGRQIKVVCEWDGQQREELYDRVLVSVGRVPNCQNLGLEHTRVTRDERGFIKVNARQETADPAILAIGDTVGGAMLAHKAAREARVAVEALLGEASAFENVVPAVVFTDPEIAWCGLTEMEARAQGIAVEVARFPWSACGRAVAMDRPDGVTKLVVERQTHRVLGVGVVGTHAGELIAEAVVAIEMGATARDLAESIHPHPTLSETLMECSEILHQRL